MVLFEDAQLEDDAPPVVTLCWLCGRPVGKTIVWHHPVPKSRGGRNVVPMHGICQQTLTVNFTNAELQHHGVDVEALLANPAVRKFVDCRREQGSGFHRDHRQEAALIIAPADHGPKIHGPAMKMLPPVFVVSTARSPIFHSTSRCC